MNIQKIISEAQHAIAALTTDKAATIASVRAYWVSYVATEEPALAIPKTARTKAQIVRRLQDVIAWLNSFGRVQPYALAGYTDLTEAHEAALAEDFARLIEAQRAERLPVDEEGNDLREWCGNDIEAAHAEALTMNEPTPPAAPALRIEQETGDGEFKRDGVHCFKSCGYNCKESVRLALIEHYTKIAEDNGLVAEGWHLRVWHNGGWHGCFVHDASGFMLSDYDVKSGIEEFRPDRFIPAKRWACYNYSTPEGTAQIWVYAATPWQAIGAAIREAQQRITGYRGIVGALAPHQCEHARAADLYGATPEHGYEVKA